MATAEPATNPYLPRLLRIAGIREETADVRTLRLEAGQQDAAHDLPTWRPGQFGEFTVFGSGECVFALANRPWSPEEGGAGMPAIECTFRAVGKVTNALRRLTVGEVVGFRGPYGNHFPLDEWEGSDLVFIGGGIGMAALRSALLEVLARRSAFGEVTILNGARTVADMVYGAEMPEWEKVTGVRVVRTVDPKGETPDWDGEVGLLPAVFERLELAPDNRRVVACGPPIMLRYLFRSLAGLGYCREWVLTTMENRMKCGIGLCGRCNIGPFYVCRDGPVVTWAQLEALPQDY